METRFSILAWEISWTEEPGRLQFMGLFWGYFAIFCQNCYLFIKIHNGISGMLFELTIAKTVNM